ncbi:MAG: 1-acyl-sn-glycerol-3-phosphate acyltransferase [Lachnospiraceae bacterium]|nr:1-acyl-sn-glycerol-3-phosphate acyltransferase [Lachnospiraceae bacterium]
MLRFYYSIIRNFFHLWLIPYMRFVNRHQNWFSEEYRYSLVKRIVRLVRNASHVKTTYHGLENIPKDGNYVVYANHEGKYDTIALLVPFNSPMSIVMDYKRSKMILCDEVMMMVDGKRLKREDVRQALTVMNEVAEDLKKGRKFFIFPEGGYLKNKGNKIYQFKPGAFKCALKAQSTILPTVLFNIYKVYEHNSLNTLYNDIYFLPPIPYEEYKDMKTPEIAAMVRERIATKLAELEGTDISNIYYDIPEDTVLI